MRFTIIDKLQMDLHLLLTYAYICRLHFQNNQTVNGKTSVFLLSLLITCLFNSCGNSGKSSDVWDSNSDSVATGSTAVDESPEFYSDLKMFELHGSVKQCNVSTYYDVKVDDRQNVDTTGLSPRTVTLDFDQAGGYLTTDSELVKRDKEGRITYWRDRRPNVAGVHPGLLRDTLSYTHVNDNVLKSSGMGEFAVTVYDNDGKVIGQYSEPDVDGTQMAAFNIYRKFDEGGNWIERLTVWTSSSQGGRPHISYSFEHRDIIYY